MDRIWHIVRWGIVGLALAYIAIVIYAYPHDYQAQLDQRTIAKIAAQRLLPADVAGRRLPPLPGSQSEDDSVAGVDSNGNGIRDDVELVIFAKHPTSTAIRAAELQYAMDLQTQLTQVTDTPTWKAAMVQHQRGFGCLFDASSTAYAILQNEVEALVLNTDARRGRYRSLDAFRVAYELSSGPDCDVLN